MSEKKSWMKSFLSFFSSKREEKPQRQTVFGANTENLIAKVVQEEEVKPKASLFSTAPTLATGDASKPKAPKPVQAPVSSSTPVSTETEPVFDVSTIIHPSEISIFLRPTGESDISLQNS